MQNYGVRRVRAILIYDEIVVRGGHDAFFTAAFECSFFLFYGEMPVFRRFYRVATFVALRFLQ